MQKSLLRKAEKYEKQNHRRRIWHKVMHVMACIVIFCTTYALILPAITMERTQCGLTEHSHSEACYEKLDSEALVSLTCTYESLGVHVHSADCYNSENQLICAQADYLIHAHSADCMDKNGTIICKLPEVSAHEHTDACYRVVEAEPIVTETPATEVPHTHGDECYSLKRGEMICQLAETEGHAHVESCYTQGELICGLSEQEGHVHGEGCSETVQLCELTVEPHIHGEGCYQQMVCELPEGEDHSHTDECSGAVLNCDITEQPHIHTEACYQTNYLCALPETEAHSHSAACYESTLSCGLGEEAGHAHSDACYTMVSVLTCELKEGEIPAETPEDNEAPEQKKELICTEPAAQVHVHGEACYSKADEQEEALTCTIELGHVHAAPCYDASGKLLCKLPENHSHSAICYGTWKLVCTKEEHTHDLVCLNDPEADLETEAIWMSTFADVALTGEWDKDLLAIARTQLGYQESTRNYEVLEDGKSIYGYTRYGAWYGLPYSDWCAMFVSFCLNYANIPQDVIPHEAYCPNWIGVLQQPAYDRYRPAAEYIPAPGDLIFFDWEADGISDHVGIVEEVAAASVVVIEGNSNNSVQRNTYALHDGCIAGYAMLNSSRLSAVEDSVHINLEDTDAWAVLVDPSGQIIEAPMAYAMDETEVYTAASASSSPYALRKLNATFQNSARANTPLDLTQYISAVKMYDEKGNVIGSGSVVTEGDLIKFEIAYSIGGQQLGVLNDQTFTVYSDTVTYKLPSTFKVVRGGSGNIVNNAGQVVGTYQVDGETNTIIMTFTEDYVKQNASGIQINGSISFYSTVTKVTDNESEDQDYKFTDEITLGITVQEKHEVEGSLKIEKEKSLVNGENIVYRVKVTSDEGTNGPITITDTMSKGLSFVKGISVVDKNNKPVLPNPNFIPAADKGSFTLTLPEMKAGDVYTVMYECKADMNLLDADMTVKNTASVNGKDSEGNDLNHDFTVTHVFEVLKKTGVDNGDGTISWTITVNQDKLDISGWILTDTMDNKAYTGTVTIKDSSGKVVGENVKLPYTFPEGSKDSYTVTYTTEYDFSAGNVIYNKAILKDNDTEVNAFTGVTIGSPVTKTGEAGEIIQDENGKNLLPITWTVTLDTSAGALPAGSVMQDVMQDWTSGDMYVTYAQLMAAYENIAAELIRVGSGNPTGLTADVYVPGMVNSYQSYNYNQLVTNDHGCQTEVFENFSITIDKAIPKDKVLTFTYQAYGTFENNVVIGKTYTNFFSVNGFDAKGTVAMKSGTVDAKKMALNYYNPVEHKDVFWFWNLFDYNGTNGTTKLEYEKLIDDYLVWTIELCVPMDFWGSEGNIVLYEDLPEGVTVKGISLPFRDDVPTDPLQQWDLVPGNSYSWDFTIYPADQYNVWQPQGGQPCSIVTEVTEDGDLKMTIPSIVFETMSGFAARMFEINPAYDESYAYLNIFTQIDDDFEWTPTAEGSYVYVNSFENNFSLYDSEGEKIDWGTQTQEIKKDESTGVIRKQATTDANNIINYSVVLNAYDRDLIENSDFLSIHDELSYDETDDKPLRLRLVPGSVKLYEIDMASDGSYTKGKELTINYSYNENSSLEYGITKWAHTIDMIVPDGKALLLEYSYRASGTVNESYNVLNSCSINGVGEGSVNGDHTVQIEVKQSEAFADVEGVMLFKVDANSDGIFLENAKFNIYIWNAEQNKYLLVHHPDSSNAIFVTDANGMIVLDRSTMNNEFAYNTAYYIVEVESPNGYLLSPEPYYFQIAHEDIEKYSPCLPEGFAGAKLTNGDIIYRKNVNNTTEITVEKYWQDYFGKSINVTGDQVSSISLELWQMIVGQADSEKLYGSYTMTPDEDGNWRLSIKGLPKSAVNTDGTKSSDYLYYIKEAAENGFSLESVENNEGINSGTIKLVNRKHEYYELPDTGGIGTRPYKVAGLAMMLFSAAYLIRIKKRKRGAG